LIVPQNFKLERLIDPRTGLFSWDPITFEQAMITTGGMNGRLAGFLVSQVRNTKAPNFS
jgi:hypothetical protein